MNVEEDFFINKFEKDNDKHAIWHGDVTNAFGKFLKEEYDFTEENIEELHNNGKIEITEEMFEENEEKYMIDDDIEDIKEAVEEVNNQNNDTDNTDKKDYEIIDIDTENNSLTANVKVDDEYFETIYDQKGFCMECDRDYILGSGQSGVCVICDGIMTEQEFKETFGNEGKEDTKEKEEDNDKKVPKKKTIAKKIPKKKTVDKSPKKKTIAKKVPKKKTAKKVPKKKKIEKKTKKAIPKKKKTKSNAKKTLQKAISQTKTIKQKKDVIVPSISNKEIEDSVSKIFKDTDESIWNEVRERYKRKMEKGIKRVNGFIIEVSGGAKTGKTRFGLSSHKFKGAEGKRRKVPRGNPCFGVAFDDDLLDETERSFPDKLGEDIIPVNCYVENEDTGLIDPIKSLQKANRFIFALKDKEFGTLFIDDYTFYCKLVAFSFLKNSAYVKDPKTGKKRPMTFDEFSRPEKQISMFEHRYKNRTMAFVLMKLKNFKMNIILGVQIKPEYENKKGSPYGTKTGNMLEDQQKGTEQYVDLIGRLIKVTSKDDKNVKKRYFIAKDSRFEGKDVNTKKMTLYAPDFEDVVNQIMKNYL